MKADRPMEINISSHAPIIVRVHEYAPEPGTVITLPPFEHLPPIIQEWAQALTDRERELLRTMAAGAGTYNEAAAQLGISERTMRTHLTNIFAKSGREITRYGDALIWAILAGIVTADDILARIWQFYASPAGPAPEEGSA